MKPIQQGNEYVIEWNGYKAVAPTEALCIRVFEEMLLENARIEVAQAANTVIGDQPSDTFHRLYSEFAKDVLSLYWELPTLRVVDGPTRIAEISAKMSRVEAAYGGSLYDPYYDALLERFKTISRGYP
ncbi:MAG: hypothetical protein E6Q97_29230 [Desulfurellales bacterium]|nr:MAG: hypothetical protein E6Q97_29230 [Desulfurellales bacterium]